MLYNQKQTETYTRAYNISIENPLGETPLIRFNEELVEVKPDGSAEVVGRAGNHHVSQWLPEELMSTEFNVLHPETGDALGTATYGEMQVMLHSLYLHLAFIRDNPVMDAPVEEEV